jgi:hypothetical protein
MNPLLGIIIAVTVVVVGPFVVQFLHLLHENLWISAMLLIVVIGSLLFKKLKWHKRVSEKDRENKVTE